MCAPAFVDEDVDRSQAPLGLGDGGVHLGGLGHVRNGRGRAAPEGPYLTCDRLDLGGRPGRHGHVRPRPGKGKGDRAPYTPGRPR